MHILLVLSDPALEAALTELLGSDGHTIGTAGPTDAVERLRADPPALVLFDEARPAPDGRGVLEVLREADPGIDLIVLSSAWSAEEAVVAIRRGALDCLPAPPDRAVLAERIAAVEERRERRARTAEVRRERQALAEFHGMVGDSPRMLEVFSLTERVAKHDTGVLVTGETGTGKERIARALHRLGARERGPFVACNCAAIPDTLLEAEFFGHERGAFTGAEKRRKGLFEQASGGILLLDETGELPLAMQAKLLRVLSTGRIVRLGGDAEVTVDVRVVSATHRDLRQMVAEGLFRADLYYRLAIVEIVLPPLRERMEDLPLLSRHLLDLIARRLGKPVRGLSREAQLRLGAHDWPGNVRELENVLERATVSATRDFIGVEDLPAIGGRHSLPMARNLTPWPLDLSLEAVERAHIARVLRRNSGNRIATARDLRISRSALYDKLKRYGLSEES